MDDKRFDEIARRMASMPSRRSLLKAGGAAAIAALSGALGFGSALAADRGPGQICRKNADCDSNLCGAPDFTGRRRCKCQPTQVVCGNKCVESTSGFLTDKNNCGACGVRCSGQTSVCCQGACVAPAAVCNGVCCTGTMICYSNSCCEPESLEESCGSICGESVTNNCGQQVQCPECCVPEPKETTCNAKCGPQTNNCDEPVECDPCCTANDGDCVNNSDCCSDVCVELTCVAATGEEGANCDENGDCTSNACCEGLCVASTAFDSDIMNCGACGTVCPGTTTECDTVICVSGTCDHSYTNSGTPVTAQTPGDCQKIVCNGAGGTTSQDDNNDTPANTSDCVLGICVNGDPSTSNAEADTTCEDNGGSYCDGSGACVECTTGSHCTSGVCQSNVCCVPNADSVTCDAVCGPQTNNCGQTVQCDACCPSGQRPSTVGDYCVPDAAACGAFKSSATVSGTPTVIKDFRECDFSGQTFVPVAANYCNFTGATFAGSTLTSVAFQYSTLVNVNFSNTALTSLDVRFASMAGANFSGATIVGVAWAPTTCPDSTAIATGNCCSNMNGNTPTSCS